MQVNRNLDGDDTTERLARCGIDAATMFQCTPDCVVILDREWRFVDLNSRAKALIGPDRDVVGAIVWEVYARPPGGVFETACRKVMAERVPIRCEDIYPPLGIWFEYSVQPCGDGIAVYFRDVTADKRRAEALRESEEQSRQALAELKGICGSLSRRKAFTEVLLDSTTYGILAIDRDLRFTVWNAAMERFSGMSATQVIGRIATEALPFIVGTETEAAMHRAVSGECGTLRDQPYAVPETGHSGFFDCEYAPLRDGTDVLAGAVAILSDTTQRRAMEQQLRQAQKMEAVGQLTGGIAHDFNNLLTVIAGNLELLRPRLADQPRLDRLVADMRHEAERGQRLAAQLLAFSRRQKLRPETLDINELVRRFEPMIRGAVGESVQVEAHLAPDLWPCTIDAAQLEAALLNLAVNARDAMPMGGRLTVETRNVEPDDRLRAKMAGAGPGPYVVIVVSDTGSGMPPAVVARAFEPFFTTKEVGKGSGLGLSQVYGFVEQSGGHVTINSAVGQGTTIRLYLPAVATAAATPRTRARREARLLRGSERILLVEDNAHVLRTADAMITDLGYNVRTAAGPLEALEILRASGEPFDLLFSDVVMPQMSGVRLAEEARRIRPGLKVLLTSGHSRESLSALDESLHVIAKPYKHADLAAQLRAVLDAR